MEPLLYFDPDPIDFSVYTSKHISCDHAGTYHRLQQQSSRSGYFLSGGYSRAEDILPLGRPELISGAIDYFTYRLGSPNNYVDVNTVVKLTASVLVQGSTPTQRGIYNGARILTTASDLTVPANDALGDPDDGNVSVNLLPARVPYKVGLNLPLIDAGISEAYTTVHKKGDDFCFYTNQHPENVTLAFYQPIVKTLRFRYQPFPTSGACYPDFPLSFRNP